MVKNIILDFGGVLLDLDYNATFQAMSELTGLNLNIESLPAWFVPLSDDFERGNISEESFIWHIQYRCKHKSITPLQLVNAWNQMLLGWQPEKIQFLEDAKSMYNLYLLSNTNSIHIRWVHKNLKEVHKMYDFEKRFFKKVYYSHDIGMRKPETRIFQMVLDENKLLKNETLYLDDSEEHVKAASSLGIPSVLFKRNGALTVRILQDMIASNL